MTFYTYTDAEERRHGLHLEPEGPPIISAHLDEGIELVETA